VEAPRELAAQPLPPSELLAPVPGVPTDQRADLGRSLHLVRTEWFIAEEFDDD